MPDPDLTPGASLEASLPARSRPLLASAAGIAAATILVKLVAFAKDWTIALRFGVSDELDAFWVAFLVPAFAVAIVTNSFGSAFVPTYVRVVRRQGSLVASRLAGAAVAVGALSLVACTLALAVSAGWFLPWIGWGFEPAKLELAQSLSYVLAGILFASGLSSMFAALLNAHERFRAAAIIPLAVPLVTLVVLWSAHERLGIYSLALGTLAGFLIECLLLGGVTIGTGLLAWPSASGLQAPLKHIGVQFVHVALGAALLCGSTLVDQSMAASLGSGNVSVLNYSNKIVALVLGIGAVSLSTVLFPRFSRSIADGQPEELQATFGRYCRGILAASIPLVVLLALFSQPLVRLLFERGAFTSESTREVAYVQLYFLPQIPFYVLALVGARLLSALDGNRLVLAIAALNLGLNVVGNLVLMRWLGVAGIAAATSLRYFVASLATYAAIRYKLADVTSRVALVEELG